MVVSYLVYVVTPVPYTAAHTSNFDIHFHLTMETDKHV